MKKIFATAIGTLLLVRVGIAADLKELHGLEAQVSYSLGFQIGQDLKQQGTQIEPEVIRQGIEDGLAGAQPALDPEEMQQLLVAVKKRVFDVQRETERQLGEKYHEEDQKFLEENAKKEGVITLPSGVQYLVVREGSGRKPGPNDTVTVHYMGTRINGKVFGSSYRNDIPRTFRMNKLIPGLHEVLQLMQEGAHWRIFIPAALAFGKGGPIDERAVIFDVELIAVQPGGA